MSEFNAEVLIEAVRLRPILWDCSHSEYKNKIKKRDSWSEVCATIFPDFSSKADMEKNNLGKYTFYNTLLSIAKYFKMPEHRFKMIVIRPKVIDEHNISL